MKIKSDVKLMKRDNLWILTNAHGTSTLIKAEDLWLVKLLLKKEILLDDALLMVCNHRKEEETWARFTLAQFIVDYGDYLDNEE